MGMIAAVWVGRRPKVERVGTKDSATFGASPGGLARYVLIPRPAALSEVPYGANWRPYWEAPEAYRLWTVTLRAEGPDGRLVSHNMQVKLGAPDLARGRADAHVALWLSSGWWATLRHEFAAAPQAAAAIVSSAADALSQVTARATTARGEEASTLAAELEELRFVATGPAVWSITERDNPTDV